MSARQVQEKRALAQLEKGLLALTEGDWRAAEKALYAKAVGNVLWRTSRLAEAEAVYRRVQEIAVSCGDRRAEGVASRGGWGRRRW